MIGSLAVKITAEKKAFISMLSSSYKAPEPTASLAQLRSETVVQQPVGIYKHTRIRLEGPVSLTAIKKSQLSTRAGDKRDSANTARPPLGRPPKNSF